ncbi:MAG: hypothetical protein Q7T53_12190 [Deltaproteobacteria bacterium]|nr:hypothetical protein [Deltaproteobacteria bacterium]
MNLTTRPIENQIYDFAEYLSLIDEIPAYDFDKGFHEGLDDINNMSHEVAGQRRKLMSVFSAAAVPEMFFGIMQT